MSGSFELLIEGHPLPVSMADSKAKPQRKIPIIVVEGESMAKNILHCSLPEVSLSRKDDAHPLSIENEQLKCEVKELSSQMRAMKEVAALEAVVYKDSQDKQQKLITRMEEKVRQYRVRCTELENKLDSAIASTGADPSKLPSAVKQLERKVREIRDQKEEMEKNHLKTIQEITLESEAQNQRALKLAANNLSLQEQLQEAHKVNDQLNDELSAGRNGIEQQMEDMQERIKVMLKKKDSQAAAEHKDSLSAALVDTKTLKVEIGEVKEEILRQLQHMAIAIKSTASKIRAEVSCESAKMMTVQTKLASSLQQSERLHQKLADKASDDIESLEAKNQLAVSSLENEIVTVKLAAQKAEEEAEQASRGLTELGSLNAYLKEKIVKLSQELELNQKKLKDEHQLAGTLQSALTSIVAKFSAFTDEPGLSSSATPPRAFGIAGDSARLANWALAAVEQGLDHHSSTVQSLSQDLANTKEENALLASQLESAENELAAHINTQDTLKRDLESYQSQLKDLEGTESHLRVQIEETSSQRFEAEQTLIQCQEQLEAVVEQKTKLEDSCKQLDEEISNLQLQLTQISDAEDASQQELKKKGTYTQKIGNQLKVCQEELVVNQEKISELHSKKLEVEHELNEMKLQVAIIEADRQKLQEELKEIQELHSTLTNTLLEMKKANNVLESEKRSLMQSLDKVTVIQTRLDEENVELEKENMVSKDELEQLRFLNKQLTGQVNKLETRLKELDQACANVQKERDSLRLESSALGEALNKTRLALTEVQIQRSKLNQYIAKVAEEKGELVQERVKLKSETATLTEQVERMDKQLNRQESEKTKMQEEFSSLNQKLNKVIEDNTALEAINLSLEEEKQQLMNSSRSSIQEREDKIAKMQQQHTDDIKKVILEGKIREKEIQGNARAVKAECDKLLSEMHDEHQRSTLELTEQHEAIVAQMKAEILASSKSNREAVIALTQEKELLTSRFTTQVKDLEEMVADLEREFQIKCDELKLTKEEAALAQDELKNELESAQVSTSRLADEVSTVEQQLQMLHKTQNLVKKEAQEQISSLQNQLVSATNTISQLEDSNQDISLALRHSEKCRNNLRQSLSEANTAAEQAFLEKEEFSQLSQDLQKKLNVAESQVLKATETCTLLEEGLSMSNELLDGAKAEITTQRKQLQNTQGSLAVLTAEHASLQAALTSSQQENRKIEMQLVSHTATVQKLVKDKEASATMLSEQKHRMEMLETNARAQNKEKVRLLRLVGNLKEEKSQLQQSLDAVTTEHEALTESSTKKLLQMKEENEAQQLQREQMLEKIAVTELDLKMKKSDSNRLATELSSLQNTFENQEGKLKMVTASHKSVQSKYYQLVSMLKGVLEFPTQDLEDPVCNATEINSTTIPLHEDVTHAILSLQKSLAESQNREHSISVDLKASQEQLNHLRDQKVQYQTELAKAQQMLSSVKITLDSDLRRKKELEALTVYQAKKLEQQGSHIKSLAEEKKKKSEDFDAISVQMKDKEKQLKKCTDDFRSLELEKERLQEKLREKSASFALLEGTLDDMQKEKQQFKLVDMKREANLEFVRQEVEATKASLREAEKSVTRHKAELAELLKVVDASQAAQRVKDGETKEFAMLVALQDSQKVELKASLAAVQKAVKASQTNEELLEKQVKIMVQKKIEADAKEKALVKRVNELEKNNKSLVTERDSLVSQLEASKTQQHISMQDGTIEARLSLEKQIRQLRAHLDAEKKAQASKQDMETYYQMDQSLLEADEQENLLRDIQLAQQSKIQALEKTLHLKNSQWENKESEYKKAVKQLEKKVKLVEAKSKHSAGSKLP